MERNENDTYEIPISLTADEPIDHHSSEIGSAKLDDFPELAKSFDSDLDKSQRTPTSSSSALNSREGDESDDLLSDYTSDTTFFDAERTVSTVGKSGLDQNHVYVS